MAKFARVVHHSGKTITGHFDFVLEGMNTRTEKPMWRMMAEPKIQPFACNLWGVLAELSGEYGTDGAYQRERPLLSRASAASMAHEQHYANMDRNDRNVIRFDPVAFYITTNYVNDSIERHNNPRGSCDTACLEFFTAIRDAINKDTTQCDQFRVICWVAFYGNHSHEHHVRPRATRLTCFVIEAKDDDGNGLRPLTYETFWGHSYPGLNRAIEFLSLINVFENSTRTPYDASKGTLFAQTLFNEIAEECASLNNVSTREFPLEDSPLGIDIADTIIYIAKIICNVPSNPRSFGMFPIFSKLYDAINGALDSCILPERVVCVQADVDKKEYVRFLEKHKLNLESTETVMAE